MTDEGRRIALDGYDGRCAIGGEPVALASDAAHAWPLADGDPDTLGTLMVLAVTLHRFSDAGLTGVDEGHRMAVSDLLRLRPHPSAILDDADRPLRRRTAADPYPDKANLRWHREAWFEPPASKPKRSRLKPKPIRGTPSPARAGDGGTTQS